jgi:hypothetical protein
VCDQKVSGPSPQSFHGSSVQHQVTGVHHRTCQAEVTVAAQMTGTRTMKSSEMEAHSRYVYKNVSNTICPHRGEGTVLSV